MFYPTSPICLFIQKHQQTDPNFDFTALKQLLQDSVYMREDNDICLMYNEPDEPIENETDEVKQIRESTRFCIIQKKDLKVINYVHNNIVYNVDAKNFLLDKDLNKVVFMECCEGTTIYVTPFDDKWYTSTRRCIDAKDSVWIKGSPYQQLFEDTMFDKFNYSDIDPDYCYAFTVLHYKNRNIISYNAKFGKNYRELMLISATHIETGDEVSLVDLNNLPNPKIQKICQACIVPRQLNFANLNVAQAYLDAINTDDRKNKTISCEGLIVRYYEGDVNKSLFTTLKLQTQLYIEMSSIKPNNSNIYQVFLELFQQNKLNSFISHFDHKVSSIDEEKEEKEEKKKRKPVRKNFFEMPGL